MATLLFLFVPLGVVVLFSFHSSGGLTFPFEGFSTRWYDEVFGDATFSDAFVNSLVARASRPRWSRCCRHAGGLRGLAHLLSPRGPLQFLFIAPVLLPASSSAPRCSPSSLGSGSNARCSPC